jgi:hypothetical protein
MFLMALLAKNSFPPFHASSPFFTIFSPVMDAFSYSAGIRPPPRLIELLRDEDGGWF